LEFTQLRGGGGDGTLHNTCREGGISGVVFDVFDVAVALARSVVPGAGCYEASSDRGPDGAGPCQ